MDPIACLTELRLAIARGDDKEAREYAESLAQWIEKGGFFPSDDCLDVIASVLDPYGDKRDGVK